MRVSLLQTEPNLLQHSGARNYLERFRFPAREGSAFPAINSMFRTMRLDIIV